SSHSDAAPVRRPGMAMMEVAGMPRLLRGVMAAALLACAITAMPSANAALRVAPEQALPAPQAAATRALVDNTLARLPPRWRAREGSFVLAWRDDLPDGVHGRIRGRRIALSSALLAASVPGDDATAALVHELAHAWDREHGLSRDPRLLDLAGWQERAPWPGRSRSNAFAGRSPDRYELHSPAEFVAVKLEHFVLDPGYACR